MIDDRRVIIRMSTNQRLRQHRRTSEKIILLGTLGVLLLLVVTVFIFLTEHHVGIVMTVAPAGASSPSTARRATTKGTHNHRYVDKKSAEMSVLVGSELMAQFPLLDWTISTVVQTVVVDVIVVLGFQTFLGGLPLLVGASKWLTPCGHAGWIFRQRLLGTFRKLSLFTKRSNISKSIRSCSTAAAGGGNGLKRLWLASKRAVQHLYKKRARYSVASELTNLVPPDPKNGSGCRDNE